MCPNGVFWSRIPLPCVSCIVEKEKQDLDNFRFCYTKILVGKGTPSHCHFLQIKMAYISQRLCGGFITSGVSEKCLNGWVGYSFLRVKWVIVNVYIPIHCFLSDNCCGYARSRKQNEFRSMGREFISSLLLSNP